MKVYQHKDSFSGGRLVVKSLWIFQIAWQWVNIFSNWNYPQLLIYWSWCVKFIQLVWLLCRKVVITELTSVPDCELNEVEAGTVKYQSSCPMAGRKLSSLSRTSSPLRWGSVAGNFSGYTPGRLLIIRNSSQTESPTWLVHSPVDGNAERCRVIAPRVRRNFSCLTKKGFHHRNQVIATMHAREFFCFGCDTYIFARNGTVLM